MIYLFTGQLILFERDLITINHFTLFKKPEKNVITEYVLPYFAQFLILILAIAPQRFAIGKGNYIMEAVNYGDEVSKPTEGRFIYSFIAMGLCFILAFVAVKLEKNRFTMLSFFTGCFAGTFLWESIGEDFWHFGVGEKGEMTYFVRLESVQVLPIVVPFLVLILYGMFRHSFDWGVLSTILSFLCNWMGHYVTLGTYPFVSAYFDEALWIQRMGLGAGAFIIICGLYLGIFSSKDKKARLFSSMITYIGTGIIAYAFIET